jgi:uncharacterized protein YbcI
MNGAEERLSGGALNAALANELGKLIADFTGRGATRSRAIVHQDMVVCVLEDSATRAEQNLVAAARPSSSASSATRSNGRWGPSSSRPWSV